MQREYLVLEYPSLNATKPTAAILRVYTGEPVLEFPGKPGHRYEVFGRDPNESALGLLGNTTLTDGDNAVILSFDSSLLDPDYSTPPPKIDADPVFAPGDAAPVGDPAGDLLTALATEFVDAHAGAMISCISDAPKRLSVAEMALWFGRAADIGARK